MIPERIELAQKLEQLRAVILGHVLHGYPTDTGALLMTLQVEVASNWTRAEVEALRADAMRGGA